jgi:hypothetical protein
MKKRTLIGVIVLSLVLGLVLPMSGVLQASPSPATLTLCYYAAMDGATDPVSGLTVVLRDSGGNQVGWKSGVNGTTSFTGLADANYTVDSTKGAFTRSGDSAVVSGDTTVDIPCGKLITQYYTNNDGTGDPVTGLTVEIKKTGAGQVAWKSGVNGSTSFALLATGIFGTYDVVSTKGAFTRTETSVTVASDTTLNVPCGKLITQYYTNNNGTGDPVTGLTVEIKKTGAGQVAWKSGVNGSTSFALLATYDTVTYDVVSTKGAFTRTETSVTVASDTTLNVPCGKLTVTYYANDNSGWGMTGLTVEVKKTGAGQVDWKSGVNSSTSFALLATTGTGFTYDVISTKGASTRTDTGVTVASTQTLDVPVARFRVAVVKGDFTAQSGVTVEVRTASGQVEWRSGVNDKTDFSLFQSSANGAQLNGTPVSGTGAGAYTFKATKGATTAQTNANADEGPPDGPPGLAGVILMIP